jgi:Ulp1 family protease
MILLGIYSKSKDRKYYYFSSRFYQAIRLPLQAKTYCPKDGLSVFDYERLFVPINRSNQHWALVLVVIATKVIMYYDSLHWGDDLIMRTILSYLESTAGDEGREFDRAEWKIQDMKGEMPLQQNPVDCGVYLMMTADMLTDDLPPTAVHADVIDFFRMKIASHILRGCLNYD